MLHIFLYRTYANHHAAKSQCLKLQKNIFRRDCHIYVPEFRGDYSITPGRENKSGLRVFHAHAVGCCLGKLLQAVLIRYYEKFPGLLVLCRRGDVSGLEKKVCEPAAGAEPVPAAAGGTFRVDGLSGPAVLLFRPPAPGASLLRGI